MSVTGGLQGHLADSNLMGKTSGCTEKSGYKSKHQVEYFSTRKQINLIYTWTTQLHAIAPIEANLKCEESTNRHSDWLPLTPSREHVHWLFESEP